MIGVRRMTHDPDPLQYTIYGIALIVMGAAVFFSAGLAWLEARDGTSSINNRKVLPIIAASGGVIFMILGFHLLSLLEVSK